jgi:hypothetical protein
MELKEFIKNLTIKENNRLIAEFIGKVPYINKDGIYEYMVAENAPIISTNVEDIWDWLDFRFNYDWNDLMEVVEKIEDLNFSIEINKQEKNDYQCLVVKKNILIQEFSNTKIEAVYNACVEFIKWYNEKSAKNN